MTHIPYGYRVEESRGVIYKAEAEKVIGLYNRYLECDSITAAARDVGIDKTHSSIGRILKNKVYLGTGFYPQIIDEELFYKVQETRRENMVRRNRIKEIKPVGNLQPIMKFKVSKVDLRFEDPYKQAEYAYGLIEEG